MDTNQIIKDGFSNPDTGRFFERLDKDRVAKAVEAMKDCGACVHRVFLVDSPGEYEWLLCMHEDSPHFLETLKWSFVGCCKHTRDKSVTNVVLPPSEVPGSDGHDGCQFGQSEDE